MEVLDPMVLGSRVCPVQVCEPCSLTIPTDVQAMFGDELVLDYAIPTKECCADPVGCAEDPCALFDKVPFPAEAFAPTGCDRPGEHDQTL